MREQLLLLIFLFLSVLGFSQETNFKEYSHTELFEMIAAEKDTIFKLKDAIILFDKEKDSIFGAKFNSVTKEIDFIRTDTITINKELEFDNVHFEHYESTPNLKGVFNHIKFLKPVSFINTGTLTVQHCIFTETFKIDNIEKVSEGIDLLFNKFTHVLSRFYRIA